VRQRALIHQTEATRTYPCGSCGGQLQFDARTQQLLCPHCGNAQQVVENRKGRVSEQDYRKTVTALRSGALDQVAMQVAGEHEVTCQSCGGHTTFSGSLTATRCPYCATPIQRNDVHQAPSRLAVDGVVPFHVDERWAKDAVRNWAKRRWFAPSEFKRYNRASSFTSVYMAAFTYDAHTQTKYRGERGRNYQVQVGSGDNRRTETRTDWDRVSGRVRNRFDDIVIHANEGLNRRHVDRLAPWPLEQVRPFSAEYVAGHMARTYDHGVEECFGQAQQVIDKEVTKTVKRDIGGDRQRVHDVDTHYDKLTFKHLLLPLWLLTVFYGGQTFQVMVNGVTGEVVGQRPWSKAKIALLVLAVLVVVGVIVALTAG